MVCLLKNRRYFNISGFLICIILWSCSTGNSDRTNHTLFTLLDNKQTGIDFINSVEYTEEFNTYTYRNFYNGVGIGDINNDNLPDIYFCSNQTGNKLYLNTGEFIFVDITKDAGVSCSGSWSTGVTLADINGDGWLDIYVCKSGPLNCPNRQNELFINNHNLTFTEKAAEYGLGILGLSNHAAFFDFDRDGDLDCYLLNNSFQSVTTYDIRPGQREIRDSLGANMLLINDNGFFVDTSEEAGIYGSKIGFGLGVSIGDVNRDGWPDIYVANDFFERDYLYINNKDNTFTETLVNAMGEISLGAMGADMADMNNDTYPEIFVTEMTPQGNERLKTKALFESWEIYQEKVRKGFHHQFARNVLQLNNKDGSFSEIGRFAGVSSTDWSWGALIMDLDNDGWNDIFVANGIYKDLLDRDFLDIYSNPSIMRSIIKTEEEKAIMKIIEMIPSVKIPNYTFRNNGDLTFTNKSAEWGLNTPSFSNGAAYGDLDNDGDLDLVVNNLNMAPFIYKNESDMRPDANFLTVMLKGTGKNRYATGTGITLYYDEKINYRELYPARGFFSNVDNRLHFGLDNSGIIDSLIVAWPDGNYSALYNLAANQFIELNQEDSKKKSENISGKSIRTIFQKEDNNRGLDYHHTENEFNDFNRERLIFQMLSNYGPHTDVGDVNGDHLDDIYICGAKDSPGTLYIQDRQGRFRKSNMNLFEADKVSEDSDCAFFDTDNDDDLDLYIASGGNELPSSSSALADRLYLNDGHGNFTKSQQVLPANKYESTSCVKPADFDNDGDIDIFVGIRLIPFAYGVPTDSYLLENDGNGHFTNVTSKLAPDLSKIGMITDMVWADIDNDSDKDMVIVGDWMPVRIFINNAGVFSEASVQYGLSDTEGWWHRIVASDLNNDGLVDFILGNHGLNSFFKTTVDKPVNMYVNDFDLNGSIEQIITSFNGDTAFPVTKKGDMVKQIPSLGRKYKKFDDYKNQRIEDIFPGEIIARSIKLKTVTMKSCILLNRDGKSFELIPLPSMAQFSPVFAICTDDFDHDGIIDIVLGGNQYRAKPETGIYNASYGLFLKGNPNGDFQPVLSLSSGLFSKGEMRDMDLLNINGNPYLIIARNNNKLMLFKY